MSIHDFVVGAAANIWEVFSYIVGFTGALIRAIASQYGDRDAAYIFLAIWVVTGIAIAWRRFNRTTFAGVEGFASYPLMVVVTTLEFIVSCYSVIFLCAGLYYLWKSFPK